MSGVSALMAVMALNASIVRCAGTTTETTAHRGKSMTLFMQDKALTAATTPRLCTAKNTNGINCMTAINGTRQRMKGTSPMQPEMAPARLRKMAKDAVSDMVKAIIIRAILWASPMAPKAWNVNCGVTHTLSTFGKLHNTAMATMLGIQGVDATRRTVSAKLKTDRKLQRQRVLGAALSCFSTSATTRAPAAASMSCVWGVPAKEMTDRRRDNFERPTSKDAGRDFSANSEKDASSSKCVMAEVLMESSSVSTSVLMSEIPSIGCWSPALGASATSTFAAGGWLSPSLGASRMETMTATAPAKQATSTQHGALMVPGNAWETLADNIWTTSPKSVITDWPVAYMLLRCSAVL
mmetsp:Transcript_70194/g.215074  ORF Transcript_70194/g.215074 Transcript_70194/m.215074 type:complete len:352 (+) Transcript_70194:309-1364(+)